MSNGTNEGANHPGRAAAARSLPKRFYKAVTVAPAAASPGAGEGEVYRVLLDGKPMRTPAKAVFAVPSQVLAEATAEEWRAQKVHIDPGSMPLTRIVNSALDGVRGREREVRGDIAKYAGSDLICYRAEDPEELVRLQAEAWDPMLAWAEGALRVRLKRATGIMPVAQGSSAVERVVAMLGAYDAFALAALHVVTTLTGSAILPLALAGGRLSAEQAWAAAHVDEDFQIRQWGVDAEAEARRQRRWMEMQAACRMLALLPARHP